jgi:exopolysaccharide biosynthesis polyprenyl glycosylphosphotransferase
MEYEGIETGPSTGTTALLRQRNRTRGRGAVRVSPHTVTTSGQFIRRTTPAILAIADIGTVYLAFLGSYYVRYDLSLGPRVRDNLGIDAYLPLLPGLFALVLASMWFKGAYRLRLGKEIEDDITATFSAATISVATLIVVTAMLQHYQYSRGVMIYLWVALVVFLFLGRFAVRNVMAHLYRVGIGARRMLVVGATDVGKMVMQGVAARPDLGYQLVGFVHAEQEEQGRESTSAADFGRFRNLGYASDVPGIVSRERIDDVIIALPASAHLHIWPILQECEASGIGFKLVPDLFELSLGRVQVDDIAGIPLFDVRRERTRYFKNIVKRGVDYVLAILLAILFLPTFIITTILIKLESRGPVFFRQVRVGMNGRTFTCYKFRSMKNDGDEMLEAMADANSPSKEIEFKMRHDPRCTRVGRFIRKHSIDELPQIWNVLRGNMSMVGPRPPLPDEVARYEPWHRRRLNARPGITGIWQVSGRSDISFDEKAMMDIYYIESWSLLLDVKIMLRTVLAMLIGRGAY